MAHRSDILSALIRRHNLKIGVEVGVGTGPTTKALLSKFPNLRWIAVDNFPAGFALSDGSRMTVARQRVVRDAYHSIVARYAPRLQLIEEDSAKAANHFENGSLDIVFIDADHTYEACKGDILAWAPKVRQGGWLTGHDYAAFPGVSQAVDEMLPDFKTDAGDTWLVQL